MQIKREAFDDWDATNRLRRSNLKSLTHHFQARSQCEALLLWSVAACRLVCVFISVTHKPERWQVLFYHSTWAMSMYTWWDCSKHAKHVSGYMAITNHLALIPSTPKNNAPSTSKSHAASLTMRLTPTHKAPFRVYVGSSELSLNFKFRFGLKYKPLSELTIRRSHSKECLILTQAALYWS